MLLPLHLAFLHEARMYTLRSGPLSNPYEPYLLQDSQTNPFHKLNQTSYTQLESNFSQCLSEGI